MAIPFRQCAFSIDLLTHSGEFSGVVSFTGQSVFYRRDIFEEVTLSREFPSFLTLPAYARYLTEAREKATVEELTAA